MKSRTLALAAAMIPMILTADTGWAETTSYPKARVSYEDFKELVAAVEPHRASRLIDFDTFLSKSKDPAVIILDSRSQLRFDRIHLKGAKHLEFSDYTQANLARVIPSFDTVILIYCNNNFDADEGRNDLASRVALENFSSKVAAPPPPFPPAPASAAASQLAGEARPRMMALNVPTYITLYGYGYRNVYELHELVKMTDPRVKFEGSLTQDGALIPEDKKQ